jgi:hypothetical protein
MGTRLVGIEVVSDPGEVQRPFQPGKERFLLSIGERRGDG